MVQFRFMKLYMIEGSISQVALIAIRYENGNMIKCNGKYSVFVGVLVQQICCSGIL